MTSILIEDCETRIAFSDIEIIVVSPNEDVYEMRLYDGTEFELQYDEARKIVNEMLSDGH